MRKLLLGAALGVAVFTAPSMAMAGGFVGINYTRLQQNDRFFGHDHFTTGELFGRIGGHINKYVTTEMRVGTTINDQRQGGEKYRFDYHIGGYLELGYQFRLFRPYLLVGYTFGEEKATLFDNVRYKSYKSHLHDISYGAGVDVYLSKKIGINAEYVQYYDIGNVTFKGPSAGVFYRF